MSTPVGRWCQLAMLLLEPGRGGGAQAEAPHLYLYVATQYTYAASVPTGTTTHGGPTAAPTAATEAMSARLLAEARDEPVRAPYHAHWQRAVEVLADGWRLRGRRRTVLRAAIALALSFDTWLILVREHQLDDEQAREVSLRLACDCAHR